MSKELASAMSPDRMLDVVKTFVSLDTGGFGKRLVPTRGYGDVEFEVSPAFTTVTAAGSKFTIRPGQPLAAFGGAEPNTVSSIIDAARAAA